MPDPGLSRGVITIALGRQPYIEMAKWLAMSLRLHAPDLPLAVLTDSTDPELADLFTHIVPYTPDMGKNVEPKFHLDKITPFDETLFVDGDCLAVSDLTKLWSLFDGQSFGIPGWRYLSSQDTDAGLDVPGVISRFGLDALPKFNGGCYFLRKGPETSSFFDTVRRLLGEAKTIGAASYYGGGFADEPLFAIAFALHHLRLTPTGRIGPWTPIGSRGPIHLDVLAGKCSFWKEGQIVEPDIIHFPAGFRECYAYPREVWKLKRHFGKPLPSAGERFAVFAKAMAWRARREARDLAKRILRPSAPIRIPDAAIPETKNP